MDDADPSISYCSEFFRPALIWLMLTAPRAPFSKRSRIVATSSVAIARVTVSVAASVENVSTGPVGSWRAAMNVASSAMTATIALAGHEGHQVQPVRPDVADRTQGAAAFRLEAPVPVALEQQPVLEVAAGHEPDVADLAARDDIVGVLVERVVADVEVGRVDQTGRGGRLDQLARLRRRHRQRLLAHDVAARREDRQGLRQVQVVRRGDVDDLDARVVEQVVERVVGARDAEDRGPCRATFRGAAEDAVDPDADAPERLDVDGADEPRADDGRADVGDPPHAWLTRWLTWSSGTVSMGDGDGTTASPRCLGLAPAVAHDTIPGMPPPGHPNRSRTAPRRFGQLIRIRPDAIEDYERMHADPWPAVTAAIRAANIRSYSIYRHELSLFAYFEYVGDDFAGDMARMAADAGVQAWWALTDAMQEALPDREPGSWWLTMPEIFHLD